jgi:signal transduction histidine kinase
MSTFNPARWPIRWQIVVLLVATQILAHAATTTAIDLSTAQDGGGRAEVGITTSEPMLVALRMTTGETPALTRARFEWLATLDARFSVETASPLTAANAGHAAGALFGDALRHDLPSVWRDRVSLFTLRDGFLSDVFPLQSFGLAAQLPDGSWAVFRPRFDGFVQQVPRIVALMGLLILALPLMFLSVWAGSALVAPIGRLARGAEGFAQNIDAPELPENGPVEVRQATRAFNRMRQRIRKLISDRSQTLASIGHDMRTPLTRLRLRLELLEDGPATKAIEAEVRILERMIDDALAFLRSESRPLKAERIDMAVLARTVADDYADQGHAIAYHGPARLVLTGDHDLLRRALDNIVGNAAKFATRADVTLRERAPGGVVIEVRDDGPGIPLDHRDKVLEPFTRIEAVRSGTATDTQGFGLGLAIARDLVERHGGTLQLSDNAPSGLTVTMTLPPSVPGAAEARDRP